MYFENDSFKKILDIIMHMLLALLIALRVLHYYLSVCTM